MVSMLCFLMAAILNLGSSWIIDPGPQVVATRGEVWPKPQTQNFSSEFYRLVPESFKFSVIDESCSILQEAIERYAKIIKHVSKITKQANKGHHEGKSSRKFIKSLTVLTALNISLNTGCQDSQFPTIDMEEKYKLEVSDTTAVLKAKSIWGALRGLETFTQLLYASEHGSSTFINKTSILDYPRFKHRGLLIDTSRHFLPKSVIFDQLEALSYNKMNVLHWHIVDDQSFPYQSVRYPELSEKGAYHPSQIYTQGDVKDVIEYARMRGIRVVVELDTPGHTRSWGEGIPELLTACYEKGKATGQYGPMNPSRPFVFSFLSDFFDEIRVVFPDNYIHLGGDEVPYECWESNPDVVNFMISKNMTGDFKALERYYIENLFEIIQKKNVSPVVWEEVFLANAKMIPGTVVQVWLGGYASLFEVTLGGYQALMSSCWYLDHLSTGGDWTKFYDCDPQNFGGNKEQLRRILGGEACMWGEVVNKQNVVQRTWPRASAVAEKLWSAYYADDVTQAAKRLEEHVCRMNQRGIPAQPPNGPGFCIF